MPKKIDSAVKERVLRMFADHRQDYPSDTALAEAMAKKVGVGRETARPRDCLPGPTPARRLAGPGVTPTRDLKG